MASKTSTNSRSRSPATDSAAQTAHELLEELTEKIAEAEARLREVSDSAEKQLQLRAEGAAHNAKAIAANIEDYVHDHPVQALGFAFVGGMLLSSVLRRR